MKTISIEDLDIEHLTIHELRNRKDEVMAELKAVMARIHELEMIDAALEADDLTDEDLAEPGSNARPEGADIEDGA